MSDTHPNSAPPEDPPSSMIVRVWRSIRRRISDELGDKAYHCVANYAVLEGSRILPVGHRQERLSRVKERQRHGR